MHKLLKSKKGLNALVFGFDQNFDPREEQLLHKPTKGKILVRISSKGVFGFVICRASRKRYILSCLKTDLERKKNRDVLNRVASTINDVKVLSCYVPHYTSSKPEHSQLSKKNKFRVPTVLRYIESSVVSKKMYAQNNYSEFGVGIELDVVLHSTKGFQQRERLIDQRQNLDNVFRTPVKNAQCPFAREK